MKIVIVILLVFVGVTSQYASCREAKINGKRVDSSLADIKSKVYYEVIKVKTATDGTLKDSSKQLEKDYEIVRTLVNNTIDSVINSIDPSIVRKGECLIGGYKVLLAPFENSFRYDASKCETFILHTRRMYIDAAGDLPQIVNGIVKLATELAEKKIKLCKSDLEDLKFKEWSTIN